MKWVVNIRRTRVYDVYCGRPGPWGNPFSHLEGTLAEFKVATVGEAVAEHRAWFLAQPELVARAKKELRGRTLGCWCVPRLCHATTLAEIANAEVNE